MAKIELGSLSTHRAYLGKAPKNGGVDPFEMAPEKVFNTQVAGLEKRLTALNCKDVLIGVSGGLDSALAVLVALATFERMHLDKRGIHCYNMPGFGTTRRTKDNAALLCQGLGVKVETISIVASCRQHLRDIGHNGKTPDVTFENAQARLRMMILMNKANMLGGIVLGTGDMSEIALGWCTFGGDHMSMFSVNSGVPKTVVRRVCEWWSGQHSGRAAKAIADILITPISPELVKGQVTEARIGPYDLHDFFLWNFIVNEMGPRRLLSEAITYFTGKYDEKTVAATLKVFLGRFFTQAFKRNCQPDGIKVFSFELSPRGWWIPSDLGMVKLRG